MPSFNLTRREWIPVEWLDGRVSEASTRETLCEAHRMRGLADSSPLVVAALTRHLLAVLHRSYDGPQSMREWQRIVTAGAFAGDRVEAYLDRVEDRMDLFHPTHPFAQTRGLVEQFADYARPIDELEAVRVRWGVARELFQHRPATPAPRFTPARAGRALLAHQAFAFGGTVKKRGEPTSAADAPLTRAALVVVRGRTLFHTLVANLLVYNGDRPIPTGGHIDACSWEQDPPPCHLRRPDAPRRPPRGYLDLLTWNSRRVELVCDEDAVVSFVNAVWEGLEQTSPHDPMVAYRRHDKHGFLPIGIEVDRAFWREAGALFETARDHSRRFERPHAIDLVAEPEALDVLSDSMYDIEVLGQAADQSRIDATRVERVPARGRCFNDPTAGAAVREALAYAHAAVGALDRALFRYAYIALSPGDRKPDTEDVTALRTSFGAAPAAWSAIGVAFDQFVRHLSDDPREALERFRDRTSAIVHDIFRGVTARTDANGRWLKASTLAERSLETSLSTLRTSSSPAGEPIS